MGIKSSGDVCLHPPIFNFLLGANILIQRNVGKSGFNNY